MADDGADAYRAAWYFRRDVDAEVVPLLEKLGNRHGCVFKLSWLRTYPGRQPRIEVAIHFPMQPRGKPNGR